MYWKFRVTSPEFVHDSDVQAICARGNGPDYADYVLVAFDERIFQIHLTTKSVEPIVRTRSIFVSIAMLPDGRHNTLFVGVENHGISIVDLSELAPTQSSRTATGNVNYLEANQFAIKFNNPRALVFSRSVGEPTHLYAAKSDQIWEFPIGGERHVIKTGDRGIGPGRKVTYDDSTFDFDLSLISINITRTGILIALIEEYDEAGRVLSIDPRTGCVSVLASSSVHSDQRRKAPIDISELANGEMRQILLSSDDVHAYITASRLLLLKLPELDQSIFSVPPPALCLSGSESDE